MEAIVLDLDGTLLSSNETILDETRETLYKLKENFDQQIEESIEYIK